MAINALALGLNLRGDESKIISAILFGHSVILYSDPGRLRVLPPSPPRSPTNYALQTQNPLAHILWKLYQPS